MRFRLQTAWCTAQMGIPLQICAPNRVGVSFLNLIARIWVVKSGLILLDIHLPDGNGYDVCAALRKNPRQRGLLSSTSRTLILGLIRRSTQQT